MKSRQLYFLDRNIVDLIKRCNSGKKVSDPKKIEKMDFLKCIDTPSSLVTPMLSMIEGQKGRKETRQEKMDVAKKETEAVSRFFTKAKTDDLVMQSMTTEFADAFSEPSMHSWEEVENFLRESCPLIVNNIAEKNREGVKEKILGFARSNCLPPSHLAVTLCLSCLYGSEAARGVIKPARIKEKMYNVMSDIYVMPQINLVRSLLANLGLHDIETTYVTSDEDLEKVLDSIQIIDLDFDAHADLLQQKIRYRKSLFPWLKKNEYLRLMEHLHRATIDPDASSDSLHAD